MLEAHALFNRQFLFTTKSGGHLGWPSLSVAEYTLYTHPNLAVTGVSDEDTEIILLGYLFDYRQPSMTNRDILLTLLSHSYAELLIALDEFSGRFILIYKTEKDLRLIGDACGQREIFYDTSFNAFASQPKLIEEVIRGEALTDPDAIEFFRSNVFADAYTFVGDKTHWENMRRLCPNFYADLRTKTVHRYFPDPSTNGQLSRMHGPDHNIQSIANDTIERLHGFIQAASLRYPLEMGITAGYDTRVLFLSSLDIPCVYFVEKRINLGNKADIKIAVRLTTAHHRKIEVRDIDRNFSEEDLHILHDSIDFPRLGRFRITPSQRLLINGHISEIARSYFGTRERHTGKELAQMYQFGTSPYVARIYEEWLMSNEKRFAETGYHYLDLFYWEERMGNWAAKNKTEWDLVQEVYSPFNSRSLLKVLLTTDRKHRNKDRSPLYDAMIGSISAAARRIPVNAESHFDMTRVMKKLWIYRFYQKVLRKANRMGIPLGHKTS